MPSQARALDVTGFEMEDESSVAAKGVQLQSNDWITGSGEPGDVKDMLCVEDMSYSRVMRRASCA
jgi:hypothetical protein